MAHHYSYLSEGSPVGQSGYSFLRRIVCNLKDAIISIPLTKIWKRLLAVCHPFCSRNTQGAPPRSVSCRVLGSPAYRASPFPLFRMLLAEAVDMARFREDPASHFASYGWSSVARMFTGMHFVFWKCAGIWPISYGRATRISSCRLWCSAFTICLV